MTFADMAGAAGLKEKPLYSVSEVSRASGVPESVIRGAMAEGRIRHFLPPGRVRGSFIAPAWFDEWFVSGLKGGSDAGPREA